jgi:branched-chain amino acid transport system substrate-binding protein
MNGPLMTHRRKILAVLCCALSTLFVPVAAVRAQSAVKDIPVVLSLTGQGAFLGKQQADALAALEKLVNDQGGVRGTRIHFEVVDDQTNPQVAVQLTNAILERKPAAIIGSDVVATCAAMSAIIKDAAVEYCLSPGLHPDTGSSTYSVGVSTFDIIADAFRYYRLHGEKRMAILTSIDATGQDIDHAVDNALKAPENRDIVITAREHFAVTDLSVSAQMLRIKASQPQVVFGEATGPPFGTVLAGANDVQLKTPVFTSTGNMVAGQLQGYGHFNVGDIMFVGLQYFAYDPRSGAAGPTKAFYDALGGTRPDIGHGLAWDAGLLIVAALRNLGPAATAEQVKTFINAQRTFAGVCGTYNFAEVPQRGLSERAGIVMRWDAPTQRFVSLSRPGGTPL